MKQVLASLLKSLILLFAFPLAFGCGGGSNSQLGNNAQTVGSSRGAATFTIKWPVPSRLIPAASNSITVQIVQGASFTTSQTVPRPAGGGTSQVTFPALPTGSLIATATAFPNVDGTGTAQASASMPLVVAANQTTPFSLTMASTVDHLELAAPQSFVLIGRTLTLNAAAKDATGAVVLLAPAKLQWSSSNSAAASIGPTGIVTGVGIGAADISVTDLESGKASNVISLQSRQGEIYAYVPMSNNFVAQYHVNADGSLTPLSPASIPSFLNPVDVAAHPTKPFVYVVNTYNTSTNGTISQFSVNADGTLTPLNPPSVATGVGPFAIAVDPMGRSAYVANYTGRSVSQYKINSDGTLSPFPSATVPSAGVEAQYITVDPAGHNAYVCSFGAGTLRYQISTDGSLTYKSSLSGSPVSVAIHPNGMYAYVSGMSDSTSLNPMQIKADGSLAYLTEISCSGRPNFSAIEPAGKYLYVAVNFQGIYQYSIGSDGLLTALLPTAIPETKYVGSVSIHPNGQFAYSSGQDFTTGISSIGQYRINANGTLSSLPQGAINTGEAPGRIAFVEQ